MKLTKGRLTAFVVVLSGVALIAAGMNWYSLAMTPDQKTVQIQVFDGYTAYPALGAGLALTFIAYVCAMMLSGKIQFALIIFAGTVALGTGALTAVAIITRNVSALKDQVERATGIAATHGLKGIEISVEQGAWVGLTSVFLLAILLFAGAVSSGGWVAVARKSPTKASTELKSSKTDSIGLWDSQR